jgi:hypothetical protein
MTEIPNEELVTEKLPLPSASWREIGWFALTFNGYEHWGSFEACGEIAEKCRQSFLAGKLLPKDLTVLRTCLFFEQRRWRHFGYEPDEAGMRYIHALVESIRENV